MTIYIGTIYKYTNKINGKPYLGFTTDFVGRQYRHKYDAENHKDNFIFHYAIRKYGIKSFTIDIIEQSDDIEFLHNYREEYYIREYKSHYMDGYGYNMTYGGEGTLGWKMPEKQRNELSQLKIGIPWNGKHTECHITKMVELNANRLDNRKSVLQIDSRTGIVIKEWPSIKSIDIHNVWECLQIPHRTSKGYYFRYKDSADIINGQLIDYNELNTLREYKKKNANSKMIVQKSLDGEIIKIWNSQLEINRELGYNSDIISNILTGRRKSNLYMNCLWESMI
jgi:group I intron endonuclease